MRIVLFPFDPDWSRGVRERIEYKTKILPARTGAEQRYRLRNRPRRSLEFQLLAISQGETQPLQSILWKSQGKPFAVPWWPDEVMYQGTLAAGSTTIAVDTSGRLFDLATMVVVWTDPDHCEVQTIQSVSDGLITCGPLSASYENPSILPAFPGRLPDGGQNLDIESNEVARGIFQFACEVMADDPRPAPAAMTQVYGFDVLEEEPDWSEPPGQSTRRILSRFDNGMGPVVVRDRGGVAFQEQGFAWFLDGRSKVQAFRDFVDSRMGSLVPFWVPTWREDLTLAQQAPANTSGIVVKESGYATRMFPDVARRYLAIQNPAGGWIYRKVTSASSNGTTETLTLDATVGTLLQAGTAVSFLVLCRLDSDKAAIEWNDVTFGQAETKFVEIPKEVPA